MTDASPPRPIAPGLFRDESGAPCLLAARCTACGERHFPATETCPYCAHPAVPERVGPCGTLRLFTVVRNPPPGYAGAVPYGFGVVELDGTGLCVVSRLDETDLSRLRPGLPMRLRIAPLHTDASGAPVLCWSFAPASP